MEDHKMHPESLMMSFGYKPELSEGAIKCPIFQTSTFVFKTAEAGKRFFEVAYGLSDALPGEEQGLIYSRLNNPDIEILENRLTLWDKAEACSVFSIQLSSNGALRNVRDVEPAVVAALSGTAQAVPATTAAAVATCVRNSRRSVFGFSGAGTTGSSVVGRCLNLRSRRVPWLRRHPAEYLPPMSLSNTA